MHFFMLLSPVKFIPAVLFSRNTQAHDFSLLSSSPKFNASVSQSVFILRTQKYLKNTETYFTSSVSCALLNIIQSLQYDRRSLCTVR